jgi:hypothetical protein
MKKILLLVTLIVFFPMNLYSRALKYIDMDDVKEKHQQKLVEKKLKDDEKNKIIEELKYKNSPLYSNWRWEISEGMTSSGTFETTLPATGDVDLEVLSAGSPNVFSSLGQSDTSFGSYGTSPSTRISSNGTGSGISGGFDVGGSYLAFSGKDNNTFRVATLNTIDTSVVDTISVTALRGNDSNGGITPTSNLTLLYYNKDTGEEGEITVMTPSGPTSLTKLQFTLPKAAQGKNIEFYLYDVPSNGSGADGQHFIGKYVPVSGISNFALTSPYANLLDFYLNVDIDDMIDRDPSGQQPSWYSLGRFFWDNILASTIGWGPGSDVEGPPAPTSGGTRYWALAEDPPEGPEYNYVTPLDYIRIGQLVYLHFNETGSNRTSTYGISNITFQRRTPMNVFVSLDSPEATSFIRSDPAFAGLSEAEKKQKLKEMLEASDEYVLKILGADFPGTGAVPPGEFDPFAQPPPGQAGDTPGVEISELLPAGGPGTPSQTTPIIPPWGGGPIQPGGRPYMPPGGSTPTKYPMA